MTDVINWHPNGTPGPFYVGAQNDALYIIAGRAPSMNNDYPWHEAPRVAVARVFEPSEGDCLPINAAVNACMLAEGPAMVMALQEIAYLELRTHVQDHWFSEARAILARIDGSAKP